MVVCSDESLQACVFPKAKLPVNVRTQACSSGVIGFRFSVKMPCVVVQWELS